MKTLLVLIVSVLLSFSSSNTEAKEWSTEEAKRAFGAPECLVNPFPLKSRKVHSSENVSINKKSLAKTKNKNAVTEHTSFSTYTDKDLPSLETTSESSIGYNYHGNTIISQSQQQRQQKNYEQDTYPKTIVQNIQRNQPPSYTTKSSTGALVDSNSSYTTRSSTGALVDSNSSYTTRSSTGALVDSNDCYTTRSSTGALVQSRGCYKKAPQKGSTP